ncbi:MAG TPA: DUF899 family protein [Actinomycetota bacterium]|nr:DUF899 family protein [Actinomycetota bacterium]
MGITFPGESDDDRAARKRLLAAEFDLRRATERVAELRRALPPGGTIPEDFLFDGAYPGQAPAPVAMSELFEGGKPSLVIYSFMFPRDPGDRRPGPARGKTALLPLIAGPCPSCVALIDQLEGAAEHAAPLINLAIAVRAPLPLVLEFAEVRGWRRIRLLSTAGNTYSADYHAVTPEGRPVPMLNVFTRDGDAVRHFWGSELFYEPAEPGQDPRHVGTLEPFWNLLDLTPEGRRPDWGELLAYGPEG